MEKSLGPKAGFASANFRIEARKVGAGRRTRWGSKQTLFGKGRGAVLREQEQDIDHSFWGGGNSIGLRPLAQPEKKGGEAEYKLSRGERAKERKTKSVYDATETGRVQDKLQGLE